MGIGDNIQATRQAAQLIQEALAELVHGQGMQWEDYATVLPEHPGEHAVNAWIPRDWTRGMYFMDDYDPLFGDAFYDGSWMAGIDQEAMLRAIPCRA